MKHFISITLLMIFCFMFYSCGGSKQVVIRKIPVEQQKVLAVLKFKNQSSSAEYNPWEMGLASMMMTDLSKIGIFRIVSRERMKELLQEQQLGMTGIVDQSTAKQIGKMLGADFILMGTFLEFKNTLRMEAQVFDTEKGNMLKADEVTGKTEDFFQLEKDLIVKLSDGLDASLGGSLSEQEQQVLAQQVETKSVQASLENYGGLEKFEKAQELEEKGNDAEAEKLKKQAEKNFKKALEYDPEYEDAKENLNKLGLSVPISF